MFSPRLIVARISVAWDRAWRTSIVPAVAHDLPDALSSTLAVDEKKRFRPEGRARTPKPVSLPSRVDAATAREEPPPRDRQSG